MTVLTVEELTTNWTLDASKFQAEAKRVDAMINASVKKVETFGSHLKTLGQKATQAGMMMSGAFTVPLAALGFTMGRTALDFEQGMANVRSVAEMTGAEFDAIRAKAQQLKVGPVEATRGFYELAKAGFTANEQIGTIVGTTNLAKAAAIDLGKAAEYQTTVLAGFGLDRMKDSERVADVLLKTANLSKIDVPQIMEAFKFAAPGFRAIGGTFEEASAAVALLNQTGLDPSQSGTGLRTGILKLLQGGDKVEAMLKKHKVRLKDANGEYLKFADIIGQFEKSNITIEEFATVLDVRAGPAFDNLVRLIGKSGLDKFTEQLHGINGEANRVAAALDDSVIGALHKLKRSMDNLAIQVFDKDMLGSLQDGIRWFAALIDKVSQAPPWMLKLALGVGAVVAALGPMLLFFGAMAASITAIVELGAAMAFLIPIGTMLATVFGTMWASFLGPIALGIATVIALILIWKKWGTEIKAVFDVVMNALGRAVTWMGDKLLWLAKMLSYIMDPFGSFGMRDAIESARQQLAGLQMNVPVSYGDALAARRAGQSGMISNTKIGDTTNNIVVNAGDNPMGAGKSVVQALDKRTKDRGDTARIDAMGAAAVYGG